MDVFGEIEYCMNLEMGRIYQSAKDVGAKNWKIRNNVLSAEDPATLVLIMEKYAGKDLAKQAPEQQNGFNLN